MVRDSKDLALVTEPSLALTVFRIVPKKESEGQPAFSTESLNEVNRLFFGRVSARHDIMLTQTTLNGIFCIRFAVGAARTTEQHIQSAFTIIEQEAKIAVETWNQTVNGMAIIG